MMRNTMFLDGGSAVAASEKSDRWRITMKYLKKQICRHIELKEVLVLRSHSIDGNSSFYRKGG
ncbi:hypothetical protein P4V63_30350 [Bacillus toyonensis]|uniref:hypothetical protein n=1 Tax=Bacillus toyonensis TaxID=155322 RepID=UPI0009B6971A|nr:hypothetical protein [Bacillus toyonensis]MEE2022154.1 hypothetical protein [Bacillus toyonensis]